jgi:tetratricopeptide (TPR) repeat protein
MQGGLMAKKKKKTRKELLKTPDEFLTFSGKVLGLISKYQKQISYALCAVIAIVFIIMGYRFFAQRAEARAFSMLDQAQSKYELLERTSSANAAYSQVSPDFQTILKKYGGNAGGKIARVVYANISYSAGQYPEAIKLYQRSLKEFENDKLVYHLMLANLGYAYQHIEDERNATLYFEKAAAETDSLVREEALFNLGLIYQKLGDTEKSRQAFQQILTSYPNSPYGDIVKEKLN